MPPGVCGAVVSVLEVNDAGRRCDLVQNVGRSARVGEKHRRVLHQQIGINCSSAAGRTQIGGVPTVEHGQEARDATLDKLLVHNVGQLQPRLGSGGLVVVDLDPNRRPVDVDPEREFEARQRTQNGFRCGRWRGRGSPFCRYGGWLPASRSKQADKKQKHQESWSHRRVRLHPPSIW